MRAMLKRIKRYLHKKGLEMNTEKTKVKRFKKKEKKENDRLKMERIGEVRKYKYLEYMLNENGEQKVHV